jgi:hypothetical protein
MPCDDESDILDTEKENFKNAQDAFNGAKDSLDWNQWQFDTAKLNMANCDGDCGAAGDKYSNAVDSLGSAQGAFAEAQEGLAEAQGWLDIAKEMYCDCKNNAGTAGEGVGPIA